MKVIAKQTLCSGHARCAVVAPEVFDLNDDGYIGFNEKDVPPELEAAARRGVRACPERALSLLEPPGASASDPANERSGHQE